MSFQLTIASTTSIIIIIVVIIIIIEFVVSNLDDFTASFLNLSFE